MSDMTAQVVERLSAINELAMFTVTAGRSKNLYLYKKDVKGTKDVKKGCQGDDSGDNLERMKG